MRFNENIRKLPADITVKDTEDGNIIVLGKDIGDFLYIFFKYSVIWKSPIKLYSVIKPEDCKFMNYEVDPCIDEGLVIKPPYEGKILLSNPKAVGKYAFVWRERGRTYFSEHVRDKQRLLKISLPFNKKGYDIKWRSNADYAQDIDLKGEIEKLSINYDNGIFDQGEDFYLIMPSLTDKIFLDGVRSKVIKTQKFHHMLKLSFSDVDERNVIDMFNDLITDFMEIEHVKVNGNIIKLKGGNVIKKEITDDGYKILLRRNISPNGVYDGLNILKEEGDYDIMEIDSSKWYQIHNYYSKDGRLKGKYINISTPPELLKGKIRYIDLEIDIIEKDGKKKVIDEEEFEKIKNNLTENIQKEIKKVIDNFIA